MEILKAFDRTTTSKDLLNTNRLGSPDKRNQIKATFSSIKMKWYTLKDAKGLRNLEQLAGLYINPD